MGYAQYSGSITRKFWSDHVYEGEQHAKKEAEETFQRRDVSVSTMLQMGTHALRMLAGEVNNRQAEYGANPANEFTSRGSYEYWERKGKRATKEGPAQFRYNVRLEDGVYKIHHFAGVG